MARRALVLLGGSVLCALLLLATGCATELQPGADKVHLVTAQEKSSCQSLGIVSTEAKLGPNKAGNAVAKAQNEVAKRGGNGLYIAGSGVDWAEGASLTGEAMRCPA
jgi:hypothetical protein